MNKKTTESANKVNNGLQPNDTKTDDKFLILLTGETAKLSAKSSGKIGFEIGQQIETKTKFIRLTTNSSAGLYSKKWFSLIDIIELLKQHKDKPPFKTSLLKVIVSGGSSNTISFIAASLRSATIGLIKASPNNLYLHVLSDDFDKRVAELNKLKPESTTTATPAKASK